MSHQQAIKLRSKIIGVLLRDARVAAGKSMKDLGEVIGATGGRISSIERGSNPPSLPELELLAYYLDTPIEHFWSQDTLSDEPHPSESLDIENLVKQRNRTIGATLRMARDEQNLSQKELAKQTGISASRIGRYENGESALPVPELEVLAGALGYEVEEFASKSGTLGQWLSSQKAIEGFLGLPMNLREFVSEKSNIPYLEMARRLSSMSPERLRAVAEGLKEISQ